LTKIDFYCTTLKDNAGYGRNFPTRRDFYNSHTQCYRCLQCTFFSRRLKP